ncbi:MAG: hypothetical protein IAF02_06345 [Anaerolineae bacterium]|nr:hypothetical protein [Anaerolineae bacterium]
MREKHGTSLDKRPFIIILLTTFILILLLVFTVFAYQIGVRAGQQNGRENSSEERNEQQASVMPTSNAKLPPLTNTENPEDTVGNTRTNPLPVGSVIEAHQWTIEVLEKERGDQAWQTLHAAHPYNQVPAAGKEYLNIKLRIQNNDLTEEKFLSFGLTGDSRIKYYSHENNLISPEPLLERFVPGRTEYEGWETFVIQENEENLMLVFDIGEYNDPPIYLALEENAAIPFNKTMVNITRTDLGIDPNQPVPFGQTATGEDWQIIVLDVVKGEDAWARILETNQFNDPPEAGMEYIMIKLAARYIGLADEGENISYSPFTIRTISGNEFDPASVVEPEPALDYNLYPGGEAEGWIVLAVPEEMKDFMLFFSPDYSGANDRYLSLGQGR